MNEHLIISLLLLLSLAWALGAVFARFGMPSVLAGLLAGFILGPPGLNLVAPSPSLGFLAELAGLHLIIGAFLAGQFVRKEIMDETVYERIRERFAGLSFGFLLPIFFATLAFHVRLSLDLHLLIFTGVVVLTAMSGKFVGGTMGARLAGFERRQAMVIGLGMNGWGAVELVIIGVVIKLSGELVGQGKISEPLLTESQVSALVLMVFITTLVSPILLCWALRRTPV